MVWLIPNHTLPSTLEWVSDCMSQTSPWLLLLNGLGLWTPCFFPASFLNPHPPSHPAPQVSLILCSHQAASPGAQASLYPGHLLPLLYLKLLQSFNASHLGAFLCFLGRSLSERGCSTGASSVCAPISYPNRKTGLKTVHLPDGGSNLPHNAWNLESECVWKNLKIQSLVWRLVVGSQRQLCFKCFIIKILKQV